MPKNNNTVKLREVLTGMLTENLLPETSIINKSRNDDAFVNNDKVDLPQRGGLPDGEVNRTQLPARMSSRKDDNLAYDMNEFTTDYTLIQKAEDLLVNYNKQQSVIEDHRDATQQFLFKYAIENWGADAAVGGGLGDFQLLSTGAARTANASLGLTGDRKKFTIEDIRNVSRLMDRQDIPDNGDRWGLLTVDQMNDLLAIPQIYDASQKGNGISDGVDNFVVRYAGINFVKRSSVSIFNSVSGSQVYRSDKQVAAGNDSEAAIFWHPKMVRRARGASSVEVEYPNLTYGSVAIGSMTRFGATKARKDGKGVITLIDDIV